MQGRREQLSLQASDRSLETLVRSKGGGCVGLTVCCQYVRVLRELKVLQFCRPRCRSAVGGTTAKRKAAFTSLTSPVSLANLRISCKSDYGSRFRIEPPAAPQHNAWQTTFLLHSKTAFGNVLWPRLSKEANVQLVKLITMSADPTCSCADLHHSLPGVPCIQQCCRKQHN